MEYQPSYNDQELFSILSKRGNALNYLKRLNIDLPYLSKKHLYDGLLMSYLSENFNNSETTYLVEGISFLYKAFKSVDKSDVPTIDEMRVEVNHNWEEAKKRGQNGYQFQRILIDDESVQKEIDSLQKQKESAIKVLKNELIEFKIRLGRVNIDVEINDDEIQFKRFGEIYEDMKTHKDFLIENPHSEIFSDLKAYKLFLILHSIFKDSKTKLADYSFIYRKLAADGKIKSTYKPEKFREWLSKEPYCIGTDAPFKPISGCQTQLKAALYETLKTI